MVCGRLTVLSGWPLRPTPRRSSGRTTEQLTAHLWGHQRWTFKCSICLYCKKRGGCVHPDSRVTGQFRVVCYFLSFLGTISFCLIMLRAPLPVIISSVSLPFCPVASEWEHGPLESPELRPFCVKRPQIASTTSCYLWKNVIGPAQVNIWNMGLCLSVLNCPPEQ